jgi:hypothetical protein
MGAGGPWLAVEAMVDNAHGFNVKEIIAKIGFQICPKTITLLLCKMMDNHQTCSTPITSLKWKKSVASNDITN